MHSNNKGVYFGYGNGIIIYLGFNKMNPYIPVSHHILSSVDIFWYICLLWDWLLIWQSICPFLCLLIGPQPSVHCIAATDIWEPFVAACSTLAVPFETMSRTTDQWPLTIHALTEPRLFLTAAVAFTTCRVLEHHQWKMTRRDISYTDRGTFYKTDVREYSLIYLRYTDKS